MDWVRKALRKRSSSPSVDVSDLDSQTDTVVLSTFKKFPHHKYGIEQTCIGQGISCKVYLYENVNNKSVFAVKSYEKLNLKDDDEIKSIEKEIRIHNMINHNKENVVHLIDFLKIKHGHKYYLVLEYIPYNLSSFYTTYGILIPQVDRLCYFKQITHGLSFLQSQNVGHRDLKLENCCIDHNGNLKLIDYGSSTIGEIGYGMAGSPSYAAPEIHAQLKYNSFKCDVWSLGILLINLFYLSKQAWKSARHDDQFYVRYTNEPSIINAVRVLGNVLDSNPVKDDLDKLILSLLTSDVNARITVFEILQNATFKQIECCVGDSTPSHKHKMFNN